VDVFAIRCAGVSVAVARTDSPSIASCALRMRCAPLWGFGSLIIGSSRFQRIE
jgi:hypothetical protein